MANQDELAKGPSGNSFGYKWSTRMRGWILVSWFSQLAGYLPSRDSLAISGRDSKVDFELEPPKQLDLFFTYVVHLNCSNSVLGSLLILRFLKDIQG